MYIHAPKTTFFHHVWHSLPKVSITWKYLPGVVDSNGVVMIAKLVVVVDVISVVDGDSVVVSVTFLVDNVISNDDEIADAVNVSFSKSEIGKGNASNNKFMFLLLLPSLQVGSKT